jgi:putative FmdB family regulatory protein
VPIYEYRCDSCGHIFELIQRFSDEPLETCNVCGGALRKVLHPAAVHFKGKGFYSTDYSRGASTPITSSSGGDGDGADKSHIAGGTEEAPAFKMTDKAKAENRKKRAETPASELTKTVKSEKAAQSSKKSS